MIWPVQRQPDRRILVDIDTQRHFFLNDGPLCVRDCQGVRGNIRRVMAWAHARHMHTISTVQVCDSNTIYASAYTGGGLSLQKINCTISRRRASFKAVDYADISRDVVDKYDQVIFHKRCHDPFEEPRVDRILTELEATEFILVGAPVQGAVQATALGLLARGKNVTVVVDAVGSLNVSAAKTALRRMKAKGAKLISTETLARRSPRGVVTDQPLGGFRFWGGPKAAARKAKKRAGAMLGPYPPSGGGQRCRG